MSNTLVISFVSIFDVPIKHLYTINSFPQTIVFRQAIINGLISHEGFGTGTVLPDYQSDSFRKPMRNGVPEISTFFCPAMFPESTKQHDRL